MASLDPNYSREEMIYLNSLLLVGPRISKKIFEDSTEKEILEKLPHGSRFYPYNYLIGTKK